MQSVGVFRVCAHMQRPLESTRGFRNSVVQPSSTLESIYAHIREALEIGMFLGCLGGSVCWVSDGLRS